MAVFIFKYMYCCTCFMFKICFRFQQFYLVGGVQNTRSLTAFVLIALVQAQDTLEEHCAKVGRHIFHISLHEKWGLS